MEAIVYNGSQVSEWWHVVLKHFEGSEEYKNAFRTTVQLPFTSFGKYQDGESKSCPQIVKVKTVDVHSFSLEVTPMCRGRENGVVLCNLRGDTQGPSQQQLSEFLRKRLPGSQIIEPRDGFLQLENSNKTKCIYAWKCNCLLSCSRCVHQPPNRLTPFPKPNMGSMTTAHTQRKQRGLLFAVAPKLNWISMYCLNVYLLAWPVKADR